MDLTTLLLFLSVIPIVLILIYVYSKDKEKEPISLLLQLFGLGIISSFLVIEISRLLEFIFPFMTVNINNTSQLNIFLYSFIGIALVEEFTKWIMVYTRGYYSREFDEIYDIIVYAVFVSLGFAFFENVLYVLKNQSLFLAFLRGMSAVPGHACDAIFMGYYLSVAKQFSYKNNKNKEKLYIILSIIVPAILHGIYDYCLLSNYNIGVFIFVIFICVLFKISFDKLSKLSSKNKKIDSE